MYTARRSRGSPPPPAADEPPEAERNQRDRHRKMDHGFTLAPVAGDKNETRRE
jgi:hypothetical protein